MNIKPYNSEIKSRRYVRKFVKEVKRKLKEYPHYENDFLFEHDRIKGMPKREIVLILNPKMFYIPSTGRRRFSTLSNMLHPNNVVEEQIKCEEVENLRNTAARYMGPTGLMYGGHLGESPWEACACDYIFLCQDGEKRCMMNYDAGKGYVFLPHPKFLEEFLKGIEEIPKKRLEKNIIKQLRAYYKNLKE